MSLKSSSIRNHCFVWPARRDVIKHRINSQGPEGNLVRDAAGNLYGACVFNGRYNEGVVFKLTPTNGGWIYTPIHDFTGGADGEWPDGGLAIGNNGDIYGTTYQGGLQNCDEGCGVVYEITP